MGRTRNSLGYPDVDLGYEIDGGINSGNLEDIQGLLENPLSSIYQEGRSKVSWLRTIRPVL